MFLDVLMRRNPALIEDAIALHQAGRLPANCYVLDLDAVEKNAGLFAAEAKKHEMKVFAMTKQVGRNSGFCKAVKAGGIERAVAVDVACAVSCVRAGLAVGHLGHLVQVPRHEADYCATTIRPDYWTVYNETKAAEAAAASLKAGEEQPALARIHDDGDTFYRGHEGGFVASEVAGVASKLDAIEGLSFAGVTSFPALLYDADAKEVRTTPNLATLASACDKLRSSGEYRDIQLNAPGTTSAAVVELLAKGGATQCEPGNGLHGTTPLHAVQDLPELPAVCYLTEVSHLHAQQAYCFGGGLYIDPVFPAYDVKAIVSPEPTAAKDALCSVEIPPPSAIDYYGMIDCAGKVKPNCGDSVVFGFRGQAFVTRAFVAGIAGVGSGSPEVECIEDCYGKEVGWPNLH